jgi:hypothetical protein
MVKITCIWLLLISVGSAQTWPYVDVNNDGSLFVYSDGVEKAVLYSQASVGLTAPGQPMNNVKRAVFADSGVIVMSTETSLRVLDPVTLGLLRERDLKRNKNISGEVSLTNAGNLIAVTNGVQFNTANDLPPIFIYDLTTLELVQTLSSPDLFSSVYDMTFNHDATLLITASGDGTLRIWDIATGQNRIVTYLGTHGYAVALSQDEQFLAANYLRPDCTSACYGAKVWEFSSGRTVAELSGLETPVIKLEFTSFENQPFLLAVSREEFLVWDVVTGERLKDSMIPELGSAIFTQSERGEVLRMDAKQAVYDCCLFPNLPE